MKFICLLGLCVVLHWDGSNAFIRAVSRIKTSYMEFHVNIKPTSIALRLADKTSFSDDDHDNLEMFLFNLKSGNLIKMEITFSSTHFFLSQTKRILHSNIQQLSEVISVHSDSHISPGKKLAKI